MVEKIKTYWEKVKGVLGKVSKKIWIAIAAVIVIPAVAIAFVVASNNEYEVLFADLNNGDVTNLINYLDGEGITNYRLENGDTILVPKVQVPTLQMKIAMQGYGTSGYAYGGYGSYTEKVGMLSTDAERRTMWLIATMEEVRASVLSLDGVKDAAFVARNAHFEREFFYCFG